MKRLPMKVFFLIFAIATLNAFGQSLDELNKARQERRFSDAFNIARSMADSGNSQAQFLLAISYLQGQGIEKNDSEGFRWMKIAADNKNINAIYGLGVLYARGQGVSTDLKLSFSFKEKAAFLDYPVAQYDLGIAYLNGIGVERNISSAQYWLERVTRSVSNAPNIAQLKERANEQLAKLSPTNINKPIEFTQNPSPPPTTSTPTSTSSANINTIAFNSKLLRPGLNQNDPRLSCITRIENDNRFQILNGKMPLSVFWDINFQMLSNQALATTREQQAIASWADELRSCVSESATYRQRNYSRELLTILDKEDEQIQEAAIDLYNKKSSYGKYNSRIQQIFRESKSALDNLQQARAEQEELSRARAAAMRDAQQRQEQQRQAEQRQAEQRRQAEISRIAAIRQQWQARCELDKRNAYEQYIKSKENACNGPNRGLSVLCAMGNVAAANDYADTAFNSCMSGAPNQ